MFRVATFLSIVFFASTCKALAPAGFDPNSVFDQQGALYLKNCLSTLNFTSLNINLNSNPINSILSPTPSVRFILYTSPNTAGEDITLSPQSSIFSTSYRLDSPTLFLVHGWYSSANDSFLIKTKDAYLSLSSSNINVNVIMVDWSKLARTAYPSAAKSTQDVARIMGNFINYLKDYTINELFHLIGHSLGAHVCGGAGRISNVNINRITGLDPAKPYFEDPRIFPSLGQADAEFVDIIHTAAGTFGIENPAGHIDFYVNGGSNQPGCLCSGDKDSIIFCSHYKSVSYFTESITTENPILARKCDSFTNFQRNMCRNEIIPLGENVPITSRGLFYCETNAGSPYSKGVSGTTYSGLG